MERRQFLGTSLAFGAIGSSMATLPGCARPTTAVRAAPRLRGGPIRLNSNENPLGLSPAARQALLEHVSDSNRYPREARTALIGALADLHGVTADQVQLGTGSAEILQMAVNATPPDAVVVTADPTFEEVGTYARAAGRRVIAVPLRHDWSHDLDRMREAAGAGPALVFICNPNNPTGTLTPCDEVEDWISRSDPRVTFLVDEAYAEFPEDPAYRSATPLIGRFPNLVVSRTFSKIHAMAGLRLGYALAQAETIARLRLQACANNANALALAAARASLADTAHQRRTLAANRAARRILAEVLDSLGLDYLPTHANFVMHRVPGELAQYNSRMREAGFLVGRPFPPLLSMSRVSLGTPDEMELFAAALREFRRSGWI